MKSRTRNWAVTIPERDAFEMRLLEAALTRGLPVFGICRGLQLINVFLGGTLYQDLPAQFGEGVGPPPDHAEVVAEARNIVRRFFGNGWYIGLHGDAG